MLLLFFKQLSTVKISMIKYAYPDFGFLAFCLPVGSYKNQLLYQILIPLFFFSEQKVNAIRCSAWTWPESRIFTTQRKLLGAHLYIHGLVPLVLFNTSQTSSQWALSQCGHGQNGKLGTGTEEVLPSIFSIRLGLDFTNTGFQCWLQITVIHYINQDFRILLPSLI